jgi:hypothetical protein
MHDPRGMRLGEAIRDLRAHIRTRFVSPGMIDPSERWGGDALIAERT